MNSYKLIEDYRTEPVNKHFYKIHGVWVWPMQNNIVLSLFETIFKNNNIKRIIEIGTAYGGLPVILRAIGFEGDIITYNIHDELSEEVSDLFEKLSIKQEIKDVFTCENIIDLINSDGETLLICDGGNKPKEVNVFSEHLKVNDIIMTHDYFDNLEKFKSGDLNDFWGVCEITYKDIEESCKLNNIQQIELTLSEQSAMYTGRKTKGHKY